MEKPFEDEAALNRLVDFVIFDFELEREEEDPFIEYVARLRRRIVEKDQQAFRAKFIRGYHALLEEVTKNA